MTDSKLSDNARRFSAGRVLRLLIWAVVTFLAVNLAFNPAARKAARDSWEAGWER